jgi:hypothetical protein
VTAPADWFQENKNKTILNFEGGQIRRTVRATVDGPVYRYTFLVNKSAHATHKYIMDTEVVFTHDGPLMNIWRKFRDKVSELDAVVEGYGA